MVTIQWRSERNSSTPNRASSSFVPRRMHHHWRSRSSASIRKVSKKRPWRRWFIGASYLLLEGLVLILARSYEVQVDAAERGRGAGKLLMELLLQTCVDWKMEKVMLTCFKSERRQPAKEERTRTNPCSSAANHAALKFYRRLG